MKTARVRREKSGNTITKALHREGLRVGLRLGLRGGQTRKNSFLKAGHFKFRLVLADERIAKPVSF